MPSPTTSAHPDPARPDYDSDGQVIYWLRYYVLLVTRRRRPLFADERARQRCEDLMSEIATRIGCEVVRCEVSPAQVIVEINAPPKMAPHSIAHRLRHDAAAPLKAEFEEIGRVGAAFAKRYMVTTVPVPEADWVAFEAGGSRW